MVETTGEHPFYVSGQGFVQAKDLGIGTSLVTRAGPRVTVVRTARKERAATVYNFTVEDTHTYFVGTNGGGVWAHNKPKFADFDSARDDAFQQAGLTDPNDVIFTKEDPLTGTIVEFKGPNGEKVSYDGPHADMDPSKGHDYPHVGWQTGGKRGAGGARRGNNTYPGPAGPVRPDVKY